MDRNEVIELQHKRFAVKNMIRIVVFQMKIGMH